MYNICTAHSILSQVHNRYNQARQTVLRLHPGTHRRSSLDVCSDIYGTDKRPTLSNVTPAKSLNNKTHTRTHTVNDEHKHTPVGLSYHGF